MEKQLSLFDQETIINNKTCVPDLPHKSLQRKILYPNRKQIEFKIQDIDSTISADHQARTIWNFINLLDFSPVYERMQTIKHAEGRPAIDPKILVSLWIYGICDSVVSARKIAQYTKENMVYGWICGSVSVGHHTLSEFRNKYSDVFQGFVIQSIAILLDKKLITIKEVAQDGCKIHAFASKDSLNRKRTLMEKTIVVNKHIKYLEKLQYQNSSKEEQKKRERKIIEAKKKKARLIRAVKEFEIIKEQRNSNLQKNGAKKLSNKSISQLRSSSSDPECRKMRMANGGYQTAYNIQIATDVQTDLVLASYASQKGTEGGEMLPMYNKLQNHYSRKIDVYLADTGFQSTHDVEKLDQMECAVHTPTKNKKFGNLRKKVLSGNLKNISFANQKLVHRMETEAAKKLYNKRIRASETINAFFHNHGLHQFYVKGKQKVNGVVSLFCLAFNMLSINRLYDFLQN